MNRPSLYSRANDVQRHDATEIVSEYAETLAQHSGGKQSLLDVGSGSADVLMEIVVPVLGEGFTRITGMDISLKMVEYSRMRYGHLDGVDFMELNIETDQLPLELFEQFDRVTSFYCLHWIQDQRKALENIFKMLRTNGDCLLVLLGSNSIFDVYKVLAKDPRWQQHLKNLDRIFTPLLNHPQIAEEYESLLEHVGFVDRRVHIKEKTFAYEGLANFKSNMKAINPFPLSDTEFEEYFVAMCDCLKAMGLSEEMASPDGNDERFSVKYGLVVAYARKGE